MKTTAVSVSRLPMTSGFGYARVRDFVTLMKPRVMLLTVFTAVVGLLIAPGAIDPQRGILSIVAIAAGAGAAAVLNMWYDADIDAVMARTARRPIPSGRVSRVEALALGLMLACGAVVALAAAANVQAAAVLAFAIFFYVVVYTMWLKRRTPQNIVIGGAAGALPPMIGWAAAVGHLGLEPLILFLIVFLWTPPHFWALALDRADEYARAGVPMLPVVAGKAATKNQILVYSAVLAPISLLPWALGFAGPFFGATAVVLGLSLVVLAVQLHRRLEDDRQTAQRLFAFSICHLFLLFAALLLDHRSDPSSAALAARSPGPVVAAMPAALPPHSVDAAGNSSSRSAHEV